MNINSQPMGVEAKNRLQHDQSSLANIGMRIFSCAGSTRYFFAS